MPPKVPLGHKKIAELPSMLRINLQRQATIGTVSANSAESNLECKFRVYFDSVTLTSQTPCQYNINKFDCIYVVLFVIFVGHCIYGVVPVDIRNGNNEDFSMTNTNRMYAT